MSETLIGLLHPGEMGAAVAGCLTGRGYQVLWVPAGRGPATQARAADLARRAEIILSIYPPHAALPVAREVDAAAFTGVFVDANATSPARARQLAAAVEAAGAATWTAGSSVHRRARAVAPTSACPGRPPGWSRHCSRAPRWTPG
jgi:3-hydroxyisobutyrate dehydrogenase-like beta-hydroxyacid dehydrogenase